MSEGYEYERQPKSSNTVLWIVLAVVGGGFGLVLVLAIVAGLVVPVLLRGRHEAVKVECTNNLKNIYAASARYADDNRFFPHSEDGSIAALNRLLASRSGADLDPGLFTCPGGNQLEGFLSNDGTLVLDEDTCSYEFTDKRRKPTERGILLYDRESHHHNGVRMVLFTDGRIVEMDEAEFQAAIRD